MEPVAPTPATASPAAVTMEAFFTRERANVGIEFPLDLPDGTPTSHKIRIRGVDSDAFKMAKADSARRLLELAASKDQKALDAVAHEEERCRLLAALVVSWSFGTPCTPDNVAKFLREAPQLAEQIDRVSGRRALFFAKDSASSTPSPLPSSS